MLESDIHFTNKTQNIRNSETLTNHLLLFLHNRYPVNLLFQAGSIGSIALTPEALAPAIRMLLLAPIDVEERVGVRVFTRRARRVAPVLKPGQAILAALPLATGAVRSSEVSHPD
jgi:hypothetical protein